jgi:hypothetical protein
MEAEKERMCGSSARRKKARFGKSARVVEAVMAV